VTWKWQMLWRIFHRFPLVLVKRFWLQKSENFRREKSFLPPKVTHNLEDAQGGCMSVSHILKAFDLRSLGWKRASNWISWREGRETQQVALGFSRWLALNFLQITGHIWLLVGATMLTALGIATHVIRCHPGLSGTERVMVSLGGKKG